MRTRSQPSIWAQTRQLSAQQPQQQPVVSQQEPARKGLQPRKRKLAVATTVLAPPSSAVDGRKSILDYVSPKKPKLDVTFNTASQPTVQLDAALQQQKKAAMNAFKTPMKKKKPTLSIDTNAAPMKENEVMALALNGLSSVNECAITSERMSILDYISPNSKKAESDRRAATDANESQTTASPSVDLKRPVICRTLSYGSEEVLSDSSVDNLDCEPAPPARAMNDAEYALQRVCGSRSAQRKLPIVGREAEKATISAILDGDAKRQRSLFIIGPPGTGKSSSVDQLLGEYERRSPTNAVIRMNCSTYTNPIALYAEIDAQLRMLTSWKLPYFDPCFLDEFLDEASHTRTKCET